MLIITRRVGEKIVLGDDIVVTVMEVAGNTARIGIDAVAKAAARKRERFFELKAQQSSADQDALAIGDESVDPEIDIAARGDLSAQIGWRVVQQVLQRLTCSSR